MANIKDNRWRSQVMQTTDEGERTRRCPCAGQREDETCLVKLARRREESSHHATLCICKQMRQRARGHLSVCRSTQQAQGRVSKGVFRLAMQQEQREKSVALGFLSALQFLYSSALYIKHYLESQLKGKPPRRATCDSMQGQNKCFSKLWKRRGSRRRHRQSALHRAYLKRYTSLQL
ncbi:hypothetical protein L7F22_033039 [Adiantum nelumboides]|nr:hypothetical protein [Adiantum nelumboides]